MVVKTSQESILVKSMRQYSNKTLTKETSISLSTWAAQGCHENARNHVSEHNVLQRLLLDIASIRLCFHTFHLAPSLLLIFNVTPIYLLLRLNHLYILLTLGRCSRKDKTVFAVFLLHLLQPPPSPPRSATTSPSLCSSIVVTFSAVTLFKCLVTSEINTLFQHYSLYCFF